MYYILPLTEDPRQVFTLDLTIDGDPFHARVEIRYLPAPDCWVISVWDNPENGFFILDTLQGSRITEADASALSSQISAYVRETPGVREVEDVRFSVDGRRFSWSCSVRTEEGSTPVSYGMNV